MARSQQDAENLDDPFADARIEEPAESGLIPREPRETVRPSFDVEAYAEDSVVRERLPTIIDEAATEEARIASVLMDSRPPAARASAPDIQLAVTYGEVEALEPDEQLAFLRARLAPMTRVPTLARKITELGPVIEDPKTAYILGFVDGLLPLETIVEVAGLPEIDALRILERAIDQHAVVFRRNSEPDY